MTTPVDVASIEDVTEEHLGGASRFKLAAFGMAPWTAIAVIYDVGNWREVVAERCWLPWQLAQRRTAEERSGASDSSWLTHQHCPGGCVGAEPGVGWA